MLHIPAPRASSGRALSKILHRTLSPASRPPSNYIPAGVLITLDPISKEGVPNAFLQEAAAHSTVAPVFAVEPSVHAQTEMAKNAIAKAEAVLGKSGAVGGSALRATNYFLPVVLVESVCGGCDVRVGSQ
jgi:hypothetical protein